MNQLSESLEAVSLCVNKRVYHELPLIFLQEFLVIFHSTIFNRILVIDFLNDNSGNRHSLLEVLDNVEMKYFDVS